MGIPFSVFAIRHSKHFLLFLTFFFCFGIYLLVAGSTFFSHLFQSLLYFLSLSSGTKYTCRFRNKNNSPLFREKNFQFNPQTCSSPLLPFSLLSPSWPPAQPRCLEE